MSLTMKEREVLTLLEEGPQTLGRLEVAELWMNNVPKEVVYSCVQSLIEKGLVRYNEDLMIERTGKER